ncbi:bola-like protein-domain-containing protein [Mycotypha africana]|uniref:bola-like protein-domain-containing protein n=1 Tax=Mycotypha africana TaxID=64632 RepID=UPI0023005FEE|nr:bola-like protein-domain-containing protein [Mycotypha africana]KAI8971430.1 bola-like protein-domain-containing protein [Mycotypha africana]
MSSTFNRNLSTIATTFTVLPKNFHFLQKTTPVLYPPLLKRNMSSTIEKGPIQLSIEKKITEALHPSFLETVNESHLHRHHQPMKGVTSKETHFKVTVASDAFKGKTLMQRHRMVYGLLKKEIDEDGVHALGIKAVTSVEDLK